MIKLGELLNEVLQEKSCWKGYIARGTKKKGDRMVPNCVPLEEKEELEEAQFEEISINTHDVTLSLEKQEKEIIIRALKKNKNKRKYAAQDLGISERTLYRKIKQYNL